MDNYKRLIAAMFMCLCTTAYAGTVEVVPMAAGQASRINHTLSYPVTYAASGAGFEAPAGYQNTVNGRTSFYQKAVNFTKADLGKAGKGLVKNIGIQAAFYAVILGIGYTIDSITGDIYADPGSPGANTTGKTLSNNYAYTCPQTTIRAHADCVMGIIRGGTANPVSYASYSNYRSGTNNWTYRYAVTYVSGFVDINGFYVIVSNYTPTNTTVGAELSKNATIATDEQVGEAVLNAPHTWPDYMNTPGTNAVPLHPPVVAKIPEVRAQWYADNNITPAPVTPEPVVADPVAVSISAPDATPVPLFCTWASTLCAWLNWTKEEPSLPPVVDAPLPVAPIAQQTYISGFGGGVCPAPVPVSFSFMGDSVGFDISYGPACTFANMIWYINIAAASILAAFILAGLRSA